MVALGLLVAAIAAGPAFFRAQPVFAAPVTVAADDVEWAAANGDAITAARPSSTVVFFINDTGNKLERQKTGSATWAGLAASQGGFSGDTFTVTGSVLDKSLAPLLVASTSFAFLENDTTTPYNKTTPASTPLVDGSVSILVNNFGGVTAFASTTAGTFFLSTDTAGAATVKATFKYHIVDSWATTTDDRRALVSSTSDTQGEYVVISEVTAVGTTTASPDKGIFRGSVFITSDPAKQGSGDGEVWAEDGDTLTVAYLDNDGVTVVDSDTVTVDAELPSITNLAPADGEITNNTSPFVTFDVTDLGSGIVGTSAITVAIHGNLVDVEDLGSLPIAGGFKISFSQGESWLSSTADGGFAVPQSTAISLTITATDKAGNVKTLSGADANLTIDTSAPLISDADTGSANTAIVVLFNEDLDSATVSAGDFVITGGTVSNAVVDADDAKKVTLTTSALLPDARPEVTVSNVSDLAGNAIVALSKKKSDDGIAPTVSDLLVSSGLAVPADLVNVTLSVNERLQSANSGLIVSIQGPNASSANGKLTPSAPTPLTRKATLTVGSAPVTGLYGVSVQVTDAALKTTTNLTKVTEEVASVTAAVATVDNGPFGDMNFDGTITIADVVVLVNGTTTGATTTAIDVAARTVTLQTAPATTDTVKVTYWYSTDTFEIDNAAPVVVIDPIDGADVANQLKFFRLTHDGEKEYTGDSFTTVTVSSAILTMPDLSTLDLTPDDTGKTFFTSDDKEFTWNLTDDAGVAVNLPLGSYTLVVSSVDAAANSATKSVTFTISKRTASIELRAGWNLVSLPDSPAADASGVNDVFSSDKIDVVLSFDAIRNNWFSASRQSDGTLGRPGSGLELTTVSTGKGYWVHSTAIVTLKVDVPGLAPGAPAQPPSFALTRGWNLVSYTSSNLAAGPIDVDDYFTGLDWSRAFGYVNSTNSFTSLLPDRDGADDKVVMGKAYWVFLNKAGTLVPP
jgi:hypothetical protein